MDNNTTELLRDRISPYLEMMKDGQLEPVTMNNQGLYNLIPNYVYLVYNIDEEFSGRQVYTNINISIGYYNPEPHENNEILLENAIVLEYMVRGATTVIDPVNDIKNTSIMFDIKEEDIASVPVGQHSEIYKLPLEPLDIERVPGMKEEIEEMRWAPVTNANVPFVGEKYREVKKDFEKKYQQGTKGGRRRKTNKRVTRRYKKSKKSKNSNNYRSKTHKR